MSLEWVAQAVADFGRSMGLADWTPGPDGRASLRLQSGVLVHLVADEADLRVQLDCPLAFETPQLLQRALEAAHARLGTPVQLGLRGSGAEMVLQIARRLPLRQVTGPALARQVDELLGWFEALRQPATSVSGGWR
jgi:type III secretion system chaperone SycN